MSSLYAAILVVSGLLAACTGPNALVLLFESPDAVQKEDKVIRGVVRGLWRYGPKENVDRFTRFSVGASSSEAAGFANRYQVRIGIDLNMFGYMAVEVVPLPEGWTYSLDKVIDDGRTVNVGDIVDIRTTVGARIVPLVAIVRKCDAAPLPGENRDWPIGCKTYDSFRSNGYAGEVGALTGF